VLGDARLCALVTAAMGRRHTSQGLRGSTRRQQIAEIAQSVQSVHSAPDNHPAPLTPAQRMRFMSEPGSLQQLRAATLFARQVVPAQRGA
jgi:membrane glycosyltransferase